MESLKVLWQRYRDILVYLVFGVLTTVVNYLVYLPCYNLLGMGAAASNVIAWVAAVAFAFVTNKPFVFRSYDWSPKVVVPELTKFVACRIVSGAAETVILLVSVDILHGNGNLWKLITSILVVILNYVASKLVVFRNSSRL